MALAGRNYFDSLSGERQNQYREIYNKQRSLGMPSIEAMDYAQKNIMSIEGVKAPETVPSVNPAKTMMANTTGRKSFLTGQDVQNYFGVNRQDNLATEQDKAAAKWQPSKLNGRKYFDTLTDPDQVTLYQNTYNQARNNGMSSDDAMMKAQQATEGAFAQKANEGYRNILIGDKDARDDIQQLFGVDKFNQMDIPDQDIVLNAWEAGGIDSMIEAINSNGLNKKYNINVGWNPSANTFYFAPAPGEEEPFTLESGEQITPYDTTQQKFNNKRQELEAELSRLFKEDEQNLVELYLNADGELDTAWYDSEEEINKAYQKYVNNQRRQEIEKELEALDNQYKFERQQGLVNRTENEEKREELRPQLDDITEQLGSLKAQYADARLRDDQEAMSRLAEQIAELEEKEAPLEQEYNDLDVTLKQANSALNATVNAFGEFGNAVVQGVETLAANLLDTARGHMGDPASIRDDSLAKREMEQIVNAWRAMRLSEEEIADRTEKLWTMTEQAAVGNREMVDDWSKSLHDEIVNRAAIVGNYGQAVKEAVMDFAAAPWKDGQFEKYNDTKKIEAVVDFINENVVAATGIQMGQQLPSLLFNLFSGGAGAGAGLLEQTLLRPDFWMIFVGEYCGDYAEKYNSGEQITGTDEALMVFSSLINAGIELYDEDGGPSGVEGYYAGVKNLAQSVGGEIWEELRQGTVTKVSEDLADLLQGRELRHPLYSADMSDSAIINIQEMIETTWRTALTTLGMDAARATALAPIGRALGKQATNQELTEDEKILIEQGKNIMTQLEQEAGQHQAFEQSVNGEDPETARDKPMPAREQARDIENNEGTTNEQTIPSEPGQELPEQGRRPAETRPTDQRKTYEEMSLEELQAEKERQEENPEGFRPDRKQALDAAIRTAEARAKITAQTPEEFRKAQLARELPRNIENNEDTTNPNNIPATNRYEEPGLPDVPQAETPVPEQQELPAQRPEGEQLQNEEALNEEQKAEQEAIAEEAEGTEENPENYIPTEGRDVPPPQGETLTDEQGMPRTNEAATVENEAAAAEQAVVPGEGQAAEATETIVQKPEEPAAPETTPVDENTEVEPQSKEGNYEEEPTDEGELPHAVDDIDRETEENAKQHGFTYGDLDDDSTGVHLYRTDGKITKEQYTELDIANVEAKEGGYRLIMVDGGLPHDANGMYKRSSNDIYLDINMPHPLLAIQGHELGHYIKKNNPRAYAKMVSLFEENAKRNGFDAESRYNDVLDNYRKAGAFNGLNEEEMKDRAKEEVVNNFIVPALSDINFARQIAVQDRTLLERIMDWAKQVQTRIQNMLKQFAVNTPEAKLLMENERDIQKVQEVAAQALREIKELNEKKKAAVPVHGNGDMTRTYERAVNKANSKAQITEANRYLAGSVLSQTGNEVNNENIEKLYYAAQEVVGGTQPYYAMKNNRLSATGINDDTRRAMQMLGEYFQSVLRSGSNEDYSALMNGVQEDQYHLPEKTEKEEAKTFEYMKPFAEQLQDVLATKNNPEKRDEIFKKSNLLVSGTPELWQKLGMPALPISIKSDYVQYALDIKNYKNPKYVDHHKFDAKEFAKLPEKLNEPLAIIYDSQNPKGAVTVLVDMVSKNGYQVIVPIEVLAPGRIEGKHYDMQIIKTIHGNEAAIGTLKNAILEDKEDDIKLFYVNKQKAKQLVGEAVLNNIVAATDGLVHNITDNGSPVKDKFRDKNGNKIDQTKTQQFKKWFKNSVVRNNNGSAKIVYHGTPNNFTVFKPQPKGDGSHPYFYFSESKEYAEKFMKLWGYKNANIMETYLSIQNAIDLTGRKTAAEWADYIRSNGVELPKSYIDNLTKTYGDNLYGWQLFRDDTGVFEDALIKANFDGIKTNEKSGDITWVVFDSRQVKSATNNNGMFDPDNPDIMYSLPENPRDLVAVHNLSASKLEGALELGGMPMPSIAVTKKDIGHGEFGGISLVFDKNTIDPKKNKANKVYSRDAWTVTQPQVNVRIDDKVASKVRSKLIKLRDGIPSSLRSDLHTFEYKLDQDYLAEYEADIERMAKDNVGLMAAYLADQGKALEEVTREEPDTPAWDTTKEDLYMDIATAIVKSPDFDVNTNGLTGKQLYEKYKDYVKDIEALKGQLAIKTAKDIADTFRWLHQVKTGSRTVVDTRATEQKVKDAVDTTAYMKWVNQLTNGLFAERGIRKDVDPYTSMGNRKTFKQLHSEYNLENIIKEMKRHTGKAAQKDFGFTLNKLFAAVSQNFRSIDEIRGSKNRLIENQGETGDIAQELRDKMRDAIFSLADTKKWDDNPFINNEIAGNVVLDAVREGNTPAIWEKKILESYPKASKEQIKKITDLLQEAAQLPTDYFEAKPERGVTFDEVKLAVVPESTDPQLIERMKAAGIQNVRTYPDGDEEARKAVINSADDLMFSIDEEGARAGQEMWDRQQEYTGGESQVLQRLTGDLWTAIAQRKQQQKAENYGQWKAHVAEMARTIKEETNSNVFTEKQLEDRLTAILEEHEKMPHATREEAENAINNTLNELQGLIQEALSDQLMDEHYKEVKSALKNGIYINPDQVKELGGAAELRDFRNALSGFCRVYTSEKAANAARAMHLDGAGWEELQSIDPDVFNPDTHWLERAQALRDFVDLHTDSTMRDDPMTRDYIRSQALATLTEYYIGSNETDATKRTRDALKKANNKVNSLERQLQNEMKAQAALADQLKAEKKASYEKLNQVQNEAFGDKTKLNQQLQEAQAQTKATSAELTQALKEQDRLRNELDAADNKAAYLENTVRLLKKQNKQNQEAAVRDYKNRSKGAAERRAADKRARDNIKRLEMKMRRMLDKPSNTAYVPLDKVRKLLDMVEAIQKADTRKAAQASESWMRAVRELREDTNSLLKDAYDEGFIAQMQEVADIVKDKTLNQLSSEELQYVSNVMTQALHQIETSRQMIGWQRNTDALVEAQSWVETMNAHKTQPTGGIGKVVNNLATEHLTPQRELDRLAGYRKDNAVYRQNEGLSEGQRVVNKTKMDQTRNFEELITGKNAQNFKKWAGKKADVIDTGIQGSRHGTFKMTHDFLTTLYMHSLNQQNMDGMKNGLMVPDYELWRQGKRKEAWDREERMYVTADDMKRLMGMVTDYDKQWAKAWKQNQAYITPKLNDVSMQLNGWHRFSVENYFPIRRDRNYLATDFDSIMLDDRIANMGFTKMRKNAKNPMMLESMLDVVNRTINGTSLYVGMLIPVTNFNKVFNLSLPDYEDSPKAALRRVWGNKEMEYIERMMKDLQQAGIRADESIFDKVRSKAAPAALGANMTVVIKQAASYPTAAAVLGWKPLAQQLTKPRKFDQKITDKYTSAYWERSDANIQAMNANVQSGGIDRTSSVLNKPIGAMDRATVRMIWGACEYAVEEEQPNLKRGSDEYYQAVARKYEECLEMTQPEYGTMQRPHIMRSNNTLQKAMTMYKTQSFQNMNIVYDAVQDFRTQAQMYKQNPSAENKAEVDRAKTKLARAVSSQIVSATVLAVMTAVGKALLHKPEPYQDDKGEVTAASAAYQMSKDAISSMAGMVTGGSELFDLITGIMEGKQPYDIDASAISMINDLYQSMYKLGNAATIIGDGSLTWDKKLEKGGKAVDNFLKSAGAMLGIPYNNMRNIGTSVYKYVDDILSGRGLEGLTTGDVTLTTAARYMGEALQRGDKDAYVRLYNRLLKQGKTASQINSAMKSWMKTSDPRIQQAATAIDSGDIDTYNMLINQMTDAGYGMANVVTAIEAVRKAGAESAEGGAQAAQEEYAPMNYDQIIEAQENADASAYTYAQMNQLLDSGNTRAALQVQKALFKSKGTTAVKSALTSYWKPKYQKAYQNRNRTELNRITRLLKTMGYSDQSINKWKTVESGTTNTSSKKTGFGSGTFGSSFGKKSSKKSSKSSSRFGRRF